MTDGTAAVQAWFQKKGWRIFAFQAEAWEAYRRGQDGLIHSSTGTGKTYAALFGPLIEALDRPAPRGKQREPLRILWITPLRALASDIKLSLEAPIKELGLHWDLGTRTGDTSSYQRAKQRERLPSVLITTPESLALLLTRDESPELFQNLRAVVVDEWHELMSSKRGVMVELALARLRRWRPDLRTWGLSATLGNLEEAATTLLGPGRPPRLIHGELKKEIVIDCLLPEQITRFPWAGHLGLSLVEQVVAEIESGQSTLIFTNTRAQTEIWYRAILQAKPEWAGWIALHHGSLDRKVRDWVEEQLREGTLKCVVCTSTLDLGVDYSPVDRVLQVGSPKGVARLLQRAGRSGHQPGRVSRVTGVPTNALELLEFASARRAVEARRIEPRVPSRKPLDLLTQHIISCALGGGFREEELYEEVRSTAAYADLTREEWEWTLQFAARGGKSLWAYSDFHRLVQREDQVYVVANRQVAQRHRQSLGTILGDAAVQVQFLRGGRLGTVEESFAARLKQGDRFAFAGRILEFVKLHEQTLWVRKSKGKPNTVPRWMGGRMPLSSQLSEALRELLDEVCRGKRGEPEVVAAGPILETHARRSHLPNRHQLLVERLESREGYHLFLYPFEGWLVHEGLAALLAYRIARIQPLTLSMAVNDYGLEILCHEKLDFAEATLRELLSPENLFEDMLQTMNLGELARRQFREVARVAGLVSPGMPHANKSLKQLQASTSLFFNVFSEYEPDNLLLEQAKREVLERQFEEQRFRASLARMAKLEFVLVELDRPSPLGFPLMVERLRGSLSSEKAADRFRRMARELELGDAE